jgi:hypothetical protein
VEEHLFAVDVKGAGFSRSQHELTAFHSTVQKQVTQAILVQLVHYLFTTGVLGHVRLATTCAFRRSYRVKC